MRQALGLRNGPAAGGAVQQRREGEQRGRRFVKDGEVPVVVVNSGFRDSGDGTGPVNRMAVAEQAMRTERAAREKIERALAESDQSLQHLRTQVAHSEIAHREALSAERAAREAAEQALREAVAACAIAEARIAELSAMQRPRRPRPEIVVAAERPDGAGSAPRARPGRPRKVIAAATNTAATADEEQEPVQWWLPSFRAGRKR